MRILSRAITLALIGVGFLWVSAYQPEIQPRLRILCLWVGVIFLIGAVLLAITWGMGELMEHVQDFANAHATTRASLLMDKARMVGEGVALRVIDSPHGLDLDMIPGLHGPLLWMPVGDGQRVSLDDAHRYLEESLTTYPSMVRIRDLTQSRREPAAQLIAHLEVQGYCRRFAGNRAATWTISQDHARGLVEVVGSFIDLREQLIDHRVVAA